MRRITMLIGSLLLLIFCGIGVFLRQREEPSLNESNLERGLKKVLEKQEKLIACEVEGRLAYTIISTTGEETYGDSLVIYEQTEEGWKRIYHNDFSGLKPWKLILADVDGDGVTDILTGVRKTTHYDKTEKNRLFIFNYIEGKLVKKWTGSEIAGTWKNFYAKNFLESKGDEVIFISQLKEGGEKLGIYSWYAFGFVMLAESDTYNAIINIDLPKENQILMRYSAANAEKELLLTVKKGSITKVEDE